MTFGRRRDRKFHENIRNLECKQFILLPKFEVFVLRLSFVYETSNKNWFWSIKNSGEVLSKLKCRGFRATSLSIYDFSTLYTTLPHNLIKEKILDLIEWTFKRALKTMADFIVSSPTGDVTIRFRVKIQDTRFLASG